MTADVNGVTLKLYYSPVSFFSQRVLLTLYEKQIEFEHVLVDIHNGETYTERFLQLNPYGAVPVLQDGVKVIPESSDIIDYLEDNFSNGKHTRLRPTDTSCEEYTKIVQFGEHFQKLNIQLFTYGTFVDEQLRRHVQIPSLMLNKALRNAERMEANMEAAMASVPEAVDVLRGKRRWLQDLRGRLARPGEHAAAVAAVDTFLQRAEDELVTHTGARVNWWLCGAGFSRADVDLCVLLARACTLGLQGRLVACRPHLASYMRRAWQRAGVRRACTPPVRLRVLLLAERAASALPRLLLGAGLMAVIAYGLAQLMAR